MGYLCCLIMKNELENYMRGKCLSWIPSLKQFICRKKMFYELFIHGWVRRAEKFKSFSCASSLLIAHCWNWKFPCLAILLVVSTFFALQREITIKIIAISNSRMKFGHSVLHIVFANLFARPPHVQPLQLSSGIYRNKSEEKGTKWN